MWTQAAECVSGTCGSGTDEEEADRQQQQQQQSSIYSTQPSDADTLQRLSMDRLQVRTVDFRATGKSLGLSAGLCLCIRAVYGCRCTVSAPTLSS